ncbi:hypothetical protein [Bradyrhizobium sp. CCBAU 11361]|uniref:hypothetical protein n=1 Tax=Bradyrhizobium sp. CCBAU 11361 TaxID=1630812 RepID=UPI00230232D9|nr:hypothetical protein [Bradyrhizobium sp. CCBAU 11361]
MLSRARAVVEPELPLRAYFLSVGGALLLLLLAADWVLPAPSPSRLLDSHSALPPIRIHSERRGPEAAVIDTSGFGQRPAPAEHDIAQAQLPETEVGDAVVRDDDGNPAAADLRVRESLAQLQPAVHDQAGRGGRLHEITARRRKLAPARARKLWRSARHPGFQISRYAFVPN